MDVRWGRFGLVVMLGTGCSVGDFESTSPFGESQAVPDASGDDSSTGGTDMATTGLTDGASSGPDDGTGGSPTDSGPDEMTTGPAAGSSSSGGWDPGGDDSGSSSSSTTSAVECGNGLAEGDESCDGDDLAGMACPDVGEFVGGTLACDAACAFDTAGCTTMSKGPVDVCESVNVAIPDSGGGPVDAVVNVPAGGSIADVTVEVDISHTWIGDLTVDLEHEGTSVTLYDQDCGLDVDMNLSFDDAGGVINCLLSTSGAATLPAQPLSAFDGLDASGDWTFTVQDFAAADVGTVNEVCVRVEF